MADLIVGGILLILVGAAVVYLVKEKKKGVKCIGCPSEGQCHNRSSHCSDTCEHCKSHCSK